MKYKFTGIVNDYCIDGPEKPNGKNNYIPFYSVPGSGTISGLQGETVTVEVTFSGDVIPLYEPAIGNDNWIRLMHLKSIKLLDIDL